MFKKSILDTYLGLMKGEQPAERQGALRRRGTRDKRRRKITTGVWSRRRRTTALEMMVIFPRAVLADLPSSSSLTKINKSNGRMQTGQASASTSLRPPSSALTISTSSIRTVITSTPAGSTPAARRMPTRRSWMPCSRSAMNRA